MNKRRTRKSRFLSLFPFYRGVKEGRGSLGILVFFIYIFFYIYLINFLLDGDVPIEIREIRIKKDTENLMRGRGK